jgi:thiosulfate/3-mercaptopyruvate sulfurtransferase
MKRFLLLIISAIMMLSLALVGCSQKETSNSSNSTETASYTNNDLLVSADWVKDNLDKVVILDARDAKSYAAKHIPNAINVAWPQFTDMENKKSGDKGFGVLLEASKLADAIGKLGIDGTKTIVVYGTPPSGWAEDGRIAWTLKSAGLKDVKILNGGWTAWESKSYASDTNVPSVTATAFKISAIDTSLNATTDYIKSNLGKIKIIDAREADEYAGAVKYGEARGGHLPNAINITWTQLYNSDGTVKSQTEIETILTDKGISKTDEIVAYCTKGIRSADMTLILKMAGYNAKNYDASYYEWAGDSSLTVEK